MPDERTFTLRQIDQARGDLYAIFDDLEFLKSPDRSVADPRMAEQDGVDRPGEHMDAGRGRGVITR